MAFLSAAQQLHVALQLRHLQSDAPRTLCDQLAENGQAGAPCPAVEELGLQFVFERANAAAERRLCEMHRACRIGERAVFNDGE